MWASGIMVLLMAAPAMAQTPTLAEQVAVGEAAVQAGKYEEALAAFRGALSQADPNSFTAGTLHQRLGDTMRLRGNLAGAIPEFEAAKRLLPDNGAIASLLALSLDGAGRKQEAERAYRDALQLDPDNGALLNNLAYMIAESEKGDLAEALSLAQSAKQLMPDIAEVSDTLGWVYLKKHLIDNAIDIFEDLTKIEPDRSTYHYHLGMALAQKADLPKARQEFKAALDHKPSAAEARAIRQALDKIGQ
jgi:Flp pilus assembly protein TadD